MLDDRDTSPTNFFLILKSNDATCDRREKVKEMASTFKLSGGEVLLNDEGPVRHRGLESLK